MAVGTRSLPYPASWTQAPKSIALWVWHTPLRQCLLVAATWRLLLGSWQVAAHYFMPPGSLGSSTLLGAGWKPTPWNLLIDAGVRMDAGWYGRISQHGYDYSAHHYSSIAFYPLYPILIKLVSLITGNPFTAGMLVSTSALFGSTTLFCLWLADRGMADRAVLATVLMLTFPFAFFLAAMYAEPLYLALTLAAFLFYERRQWPLAAASVALLVLCRPNGIVIVAGLGVLAWQHRWLAWQAVAPLAAAPLALSAFALYQYVTFGTPFASIQAQGPWQRGFGQALSDVTLHGRPDRPTAYLAGMLLVGVLFLASLRLVYRHLGLAYAVFAGLSVLVPASTGLISLERFVVVDFPVFAAVACIRSRLWQTGLILAQIYLLLFFAAAFEAGWGVF